VTPGRNPAGTSYTAPPCSGKLGTFPGGTIPGTRTISFTATIPASVPPGEPFYVQGVVLRSEEPPILTNISMVVTTPVWP
jgi:hypothetical protein